MEGSLRIAVEAHEHRECPQLGRGRTSAQRCKPAPKELMYAMTNHVLSGTDLSGSAASEPDVYEDPILISAEAAALCGVSLRTWRRLEAEGNVPNPVLVGGRIRRYRRAEVRAWVESGCPSREEWESIRLVQQRRKGK